MNEATKREASTKAGDQFGTSKVGSPAANKMFKMLNASDRAFMEAHLQEVGFLEDYQIASNSFGFPFIPIPAPRRSNDRIRLAPTNASSDILGHPIYWISPELTQIQSGENRENWSIRMFYLILGFNLWTEDFRWINVLDQNHFMYGDSDLNAYHSTSNPPCFADSIPLLKEENLHVALDTVLTQYKMTVAQYSQTLKKDVGKFLSDQMNAMLKAKQIIGADNVYKPHIHPGDSDGFWVQEVVPSLKRHSIDYERRLDQNMMLSPMYDTLIKEFSKIKDLFVAMDHVTAVITVPVLRKNESGASAYSAMVSYMTLTTEKAKQRSGQYDFSAEIEEITSSGRREQAVLDLSRRAYRAYSSCWKRMRLALINYERMLNDLPLFYSYTELEHYLTDQEAQVSRIHSSAFHEQIRKELEL